MDRDELIDLFTEFGPIVLRRMFSGFGIVADGVNFAMSLRAGLIFRVDDLTVARYEAEGAKPFQYETRNKTVTVTSYRHLPERLYDDPEELAVWAREAVGAAQRVKLRKESKARKTKGKMAGTKPIKAITASKPMSRERQAANSKARKTGVKKVVRTTKRQAT